MSKYQPFDEWKASLLAMHEDSDEPTPGAMLMATRVNERLKRKTKDSKRDQIPCDTEDD